MADTSELLKKNKAFLLAFTNFKRNQRKDLLKHASRTQVLSVVEIIVNILNANISIPDVVYRLMEKYKSVFRKLIEKQSWKKRKAILEKITEVVVKIFKRILHEIYADFVNDEI